jgi:hypothetical protein
MALNIIRDTKTNHSAETEGVWVDYQSGSRLLLARFENEKAQTYRIESFRENESVIKGKDLVKADEKAREISTKALAKFVLLGWEGIVDDNGEAVPYSEELAYHYLTESRDFARDVIFESNQREKYLESTIAADVAKVKK